MKVDTATPSWLNDLPWLSCSNLETLSNAEKLPILGDVVQVCHHLLRDLGVQWKPQPVDDELRRRTVDWIKCEIEPEVGPINKAFLYSADVGVTYTERVYEGFDFETKLLMVKYVTTAIYLDDLIDKDASVARQAEQFLLSIVNGERPTGAFLEQYRKSSLDLARHMSDPLAGNMLLHSCTSFIEACVHENRNAQAKFFSSIGDINVEYARDVEERNSAARGRCIPLPLDADFDRVSGHLTPHMWPTWLREKSAIAEVFAITSFRAPGGIDMPMRLWASALPEMRVFIMYINDVLSFAKELIADDFASYIAVVTKERRQIGMPGSAPDGGWCLRDTFGEVYGRILSTASRINRLLRPSPGARYSMDGHLRSIAELIVLQEDDGLDTIKRNESMKALCMALWETHQKGYVAWHFQTPRYQLFDLSQDTVAMIREKPAGPEWMMSQFPQLL
ncbi:hypothetical protein HJFPF1_02469 [Paramyrothecium foliicola]|nr:hypothetical protein HJFPF1_02469 [Paramyrothecium foliicola]